jgi:hypothetical protein
MRGVFRPEDHLTPDLRAERGNSLGCIAGALSFTEYRQGLEAAGFTDVSLTSTHRVADGMHSAVVRATKPVTAPFPPAAGTARSAGGSSCCT